MEEWTNKLSHSIRSLPSDIQELNLQDLNDIASQLEWVEYILFNRALCHYQSEHWNSSISDILQILHIETLHELTLDTYQVKFEKLEPNLLFDSLTLLVECLFHTTKDSSSSLLPIILNIMSCYFSRSKNLEPKEKICLVILYKCRFDLESYIHEFHFGHLKQCISYLKTSKDPKNISNLIAKIMSKLEATAIAQTFDTLE